MNIETTSVLITGGSRGLGAALGAELARAGARIVLVARGESALREVVSRIRAEGGEAHALAADVGDKESIHRIVGAAAGLIGPLDVLVNGAATLGPLPMPHLLDTPCEALETVLQENLLGPFRLAKAVLGSMTLRGSGLVINVTSDAAVIPYPGWGAYGVSKAALEQLTRIWAAELADTDVRILSVDPGEMDTRMHADAVPDADRSALPSAADAARAIAALIRSSRSLRSGDRIDLSAEVATERTRRRAATAGTEPDPLGNPLAIARKVLDTDGNAMAVETSLDPENRAVAAETTLDADRRTESDVTMVHTEAHGKPDRPALADGPVLTGGRR